jgi:hypothetical protein
MSPDDRSIRKSLMVDLERRDAEDPRDVVQEFLPLNCMKVPTLLTRSSPPINST